MCAAVWTPRAAPVFRDRVASKAFLSLARLIFPLYSRVGLRVQGTRIEGCDRYAAVYARAKRGEARFIVAFRHPGDADPHLMYNALANGVAPGLRAAGVERPGGARFLAGAEILLWAGPLARAALTLSGAIFVRHGSAGKDAVDAAISHLVRSPEPLALAPEGQISYREARVAALESGLASIAWLARDRARRASGAAAPEFLVVPAAVEYHYEAGPRGRAAFERALAGLESYLGIDAGPASLGASTRLARAWAAIVDTFEAAWSRRYGEALPPLDSLAGRHARLAAVALRRLEAFYGVAPAGPPEARVLAVRAAVFAGLFEGPGGAPFAAAIERSHAAEAWGLWHLEETADIAVHLDPGILDRGLRADEEAETLLNLLDLANRITGGNVSTRSKPLRRRAVVRFGDPLPLPEGKRREVAAACVAGLERAFRALYEEREES